MMSEHGTRRVGTATPGDPDPGPGSVEPLEPLPRQLVAVMRAELPSLYTEIEEEIARAIPVYAALAGGPYGHLLQQSTRNAVSAFVEQVANPGAAFPERDELCRACGRLEALHGRTLDDLHRSYRLGVRVAWRRAIKTAQRYRVPAAVMSVFADALFGYVEELIALSREGYEEARARSGSDVTKQRRKLLRVLVAGGETSGTDLAELAERASWPLPAEATLVALGIPAARLALNHLDDDVLADLADARPYLLVPGPFDERRQRMLHRALGGGHAAAGPAMVPVRAELSLRWARQTLRLVEDGAIVAAGGATVLSDDNMLTLWLLGDRAMIERLAERQLGPIAEMTPTRQKRLSETLLAWLTTQGNALRMAEQLQIHPQTVRYRMRLLTETFGELLEDADWRITTEIVLRAQQLRQHEPAES